MRFTITTHAGLDGARLSLAGQWGNLPFPSVVDAEARARAIAAGKPHSIEHSQIMKRLR